MKSMTESESFLNSLEASLSREDADEASQETKEQWKQGLASLIAEKMEELSALKKIKGPKPKGEQQWGRLLAAKQEVLDYLLDLVKMIDSLGDPLTEDHMDLRKPHSMHWFTIRSQMIRKLTTTNLPGCDHTIMRSKSNKKA